MKINKILAALIAVFTVVACTQKAEKTESTQKSNTYVITLRAIVEKNDDFQLFYKEDVSQPNFDEVTSLWQGVQGSPAAQDIVFSLPEDVVPAQLRLDFGQNKDQGAIKIEKFTISYNDKKFEVNGTDFFNYVSVDENFAKIDAAQGKLMPYVTATGVYDPMGYTLPLLNDELSKLAQ